MQWVFSKGKMCYQNHTNAWYCRREEDKPMIPKGFCWCCFCLFCFVLFFHWTTCFITFSFLSLNQGCLGVITRFERMLSFWSCQNRTCFINVRVGMWESRPLLQCAPCENQLMRPQESSRMSDSWSGPDFENSSLALLSERILLRCIVVVLQASIQV